MKSKVTYKLMIYIHTFPFNGDKFYLIMWLDTGLKDAFIISLNSSESIDATKKGSLARFINHSW